MAPIENAGKKRELAPLTLCTEDSNLVETRMDSDQDLQSAERLRDACGRVSAELCKVIVGQQHVIEELLIVLFAGGHCLLVGVPGLAKTLMIRTLADALSLDFRRIQFTPDLMPSDIIGTEVIQEDRSTGQRQLRFLPGPADKHYAEQLHEDVAIRKFIKKKLFHAGISKVVIERTGEKIVVNIHTARPGILIGKRGAEVETLREELKQFTSRDVFINVKEIRKAELDAQLVAENIALQLERRVAFRRAMKKAMISTMKFGCCSFPVKLPRKLSPAGMRSRWRCRSSTWFWFSTSVFSRSPGCSRNSLS